MLKTLPRQILSAFVFTKEVAVALVVNLLVITFILFSQNSLPPKVPLFYGRPYGGEQLAPQYFLVIPPIAAIVIALINSTIIVFLKSDFLQKVLLVTVYTITLLSTITVLKIISLVGAI